MNLKLSTASQHLNPGGLYKLQNICSTSAKTYFISFSCKAHEQEISSIPSPVKHAGNLSSSSSLQPRGYPKKLRAGVSCPHPRAGQGSATAGEAGLWGWENIKLRGEPKGDAKGVRSWFIQGMGFSPVFPSHSQNISFQKAQGGHRKGQSNHLGPDFLTVHGCQKAESSPIQSCL